MTIHCNNFSMNSTNTMFLNFWLIFYSYLCSIFWLIHYIYKCAKSFVVKALANKIFMFSHKNGHKMAYWLTVICQKLKLLLFLSQNSDHNMLTIGHKCWIDVLNRQMCSWFSCCSEYFVIRITTFKRNIMHIVNTKNWT